MKTIISGSRTIDDPDLLERAIDECGWDVTEVVCGGAIGADELGRRWAQRNQIPVVDFPANWKGYEKKFAGRRRNERMADYADAIIALWDGSSPGTKDMIERADAHGLKMAVRFSDE